MKKIFIVILLFKYLYATDLQKVSLQLMWLDQFQFAGFYIAKEKGFYEKAGLDVEFKKFQNDTNVLEEVTQNRATFGLGSSSLIVHKSNGEDISIFGAIFQTSPLVILALKNSNIDSIKDLKTAIVGNDVNGNKGFLHLVNEIDKKVDAMEAKNILLEENMKNVKFISRGFIMGLIGFIFWLFQKN